MVGTGRMRRGIQLNPETEAILTAILDSRNSIVAKLDAMNNRLDATNTKLEATNTKLEAVAADVATVKGM
jgi:hypothetical protein